MSIFFKEGWGQGINIPCLYLYFISIFLYDLKDGSVKERSGNIVIVCVCLKSRDSILIFTTSCAEGTDLIQKLIKLIHWISVCVKVWQARRPEVDHQRLGLWTEPLVTSELGVVLQPVGFLGNGGATVFVDLAGTSQRRACLTWNGRGVAAVSGGRRIA